MHWFWRAVIALVLAVLQTIMLHVLGKHAAITFRGNYWVYQELLAFLMWCTVTPVLFIVSYRIVPRVFGYKTHDGETRCRKCGYILRGISEPRCPECGERI